MRIDSRFHRSALRFAFCLALLYHLASITMANLPRNTALGSRVHSWFSPYTSYWGLWQDWAMFTTIPYFASLTPVLEVKTASGETTDYGPMLPQLEAAPDSLRLTSLFGRMVWSRSSYSRQIGRYERIACQAVEKRTGKVPASVRVRLDGQRLHRLDTVRSGGLTAYPQQASSRAFSCGASNATPRSKALRKQ